LQTALAAETHPAEGECLEEQRKKNNDNNNNNSIQFFIIYVPSQQPNGQLQTQHSLDAGI
jgi:hypothetical protein